MAGAAHSLIDARGAAPAGWAGSEQRCQVAALRRDDGDLPVTEWDALGAAASMPNPFFERWSLLPALVACDPDSRVEIVCVRSQGRLIGLVPMTLSGDYYGYRVPHRSIWLHANAFCGAPLVAQGFEDAFWDALLGWADNASGYPLFLHLAALPSDGALYDSLKRCAGQRPAAVVMRESRALLTSALTPDAYYEEALSAKKRKELRRQFRRLGEEGTVSFDRRTDGVELDEWIDAFLELEMAGWKGAENSALGSAVATKEMFRQTMRGAAAAGRLERLTLSLDDAPIAMLANFVTPPGCYSYKTTYDERYARFSPGVLLQRENLDVLSREDIDWSDSCAAADHPMIDRIWREKRDVLRVSIALGGIVRRQAARALFAAETRSCVSDL